MRNVNWRRDEAALDASVAIAIDHRACLAYDEWRQAGANDHEAHEAAVAAVQTVLALPWQEACIEAENAIDPLSSRVALAGRTAH
jgi:hypothetical protein